MPNNAAIRRMRPLLGTFVEIQAAGGQAESAINRAFERIQSIHQQLGFQQQDSELSRLNLLAYRSPQPVSASTWRLLRLSQWLYRCSHQLFNPATAVQLVKAGRLPDHGFDLAAEQDFAQLQFLPQQKIRFRRPMILSLDGIAKGYAVDLALHALRAAGVSAGSINAGGDLRVFGGCTSELWTQLPDGRRVLLGQLAQAAAASSHINTHGDDRHPGWICQEQVSGPAGTVTILARSAWLADALTKVAPFDRGALARQMGASVFINGVAI